MAREGVIELAVEWHDLTANGLQQPGGKGPGGAVAALGIKSGCGVHRPSASPLVGGCIASKDSRR